MLPATMAFMPVAGHAVETNHVLQKGRPIMSSQKKKKGLNRVYLLQFCHNGTAAKGNESRESAERDEQEAE
jgi:hypothetical protein